MKQLVFATHNANKLAEVQFMLQAHYHVIGLDDLGYKGEIPETGATFAENASLKTHFVFEQFGLDCFGDDSGLEVEALNQEPGIYSARYSGSGEKANIALILEKLDGVENRKARFKTVVSLLQDGKEYFFEGELKGHITKAPIGDNGFGYDPIFQPDGYDITLAQMSMVEKNAISHRAMATRQLKDWLIIQVIK
jgi:XTP/dITP diphosphohydrolase